MDTKLRELERRALAGDSDARLRWAEEMKRLGHQEVEYSVSTIELTDKVFTTDELSQLVSQSIKASDKNIYYKFTLHFSGNSSSCCGNYNCYCDNDDATVYATVYGRRLETEKEKTVREKRIKAAEEQTKKYARQQAKARRDSKRAAEERELAIYQRLKRRFESQDKVDQILASLGAEAEAKVREYKPSYFKSWFWRKSGKLDNRSPDEVYDAGEIELLKNFALKRL